MGKQLTKVIYKPDPTKTEEYIVIVNPEEFKKWSDGDTSIPLVEVVDSFQVFFSEQGSQGLLGHASKQQLENTFGTSKDTEVVEQILNKGKSQAGDAIMTHTFVKNAAKSSLVIDNKGKGLSGI
ncbi:ATPase [Stygiomarasmius scandens]|uniref:ATPase n=1 Tax=Marasmiellus scandens TaxID=2682957 RepID=A0ABR1K2I9_9AGAR